MRPDHEMTYEMRGIVLQGVVLAVDDTGQAQTITVQTADGIIRTDIEVQQAFGVASAPPAAGAVANLFAVGADPGQFVAMPLCNASYRFGNLQPGDGGVIYAQDGSRLRVRAGGIVEIIGLTQVEMLTPNAVINAPGGVSITGNVAIAGDLSTTGNIVDGQGATGSFATGDGRTVTVQNGLITNIS